LPASSSAASRNRRCAIEHQDRGRASAVRYRIGELVRSGAGAEDPWTDRFGWCSIVSHVEEADPLRFTLVADGEVRLGEPLDRPSIAIGDHHRQLHQPRCGAERLALLPGGYYTSGPE